jgi:hypothetical protein
MRIHATIVCALLVAAPPGAAARGGHHHAHQHGVATLQVSLEGGRLQIALESPADSVVGFEHAPRTETQKASVARAEARLKQPAELFALPAAAECRPEPARVEMRLPAPGSTDVHSEIEAEWRWTCAKPEALAWVDVQLFKAFSRLKQLRAEVVTGRGQQKAILRPGAARLKLAA